MKERLELEILVESDKAKKNLKETTEEVDNLGNESEKTAKEVDKSFDDISNSIKDGLSAAAGLIAGVSAALVGIAAGSKDYRIAQGKLQASFKSAGAEAKTASKVYKDLNKILGDSDVAVEAAGHLAQLTTDAEELSEWTDICTGVFATFGDSLPIEGLTEAINHTSKLGEVQGTLADALEWAGISVDDFNAELAECNTEQDRQKKIMETLSGIYDEAAATYEEMNADLIAANEATENWNAQMANLGEHIEPAITGFKNLGASILEKFEEPIKDVSEFLVDSFIPAIETAVDWIVENNDVVLATVGALGAAVAAYQGYKAAVALAEGVQILFNTAVNANPLGLFLTTVGLITTAIVAYQEIMRLTSDDTSHLTEKEKELIDAIDDSTESINKNREAYEKKAEAIGAETEHHKELVEELDKLVDANGRVKEADQARVDFILNELNTAYDTEYEMVNGVIENYDDLKTKIYEVIDAKTANSLLEAKNEAYVQAIQNEDTALQQVIAAEKDYQAQKEKSKEADEILAKAREELRQKALEGDGRSLASDAKRVESLESAANREKKLLDEKKLKYDEASKNYSSFYNDIEEYENASMLVQQGNYKEAIEILKNKGQSYFDYSDDVDAATQEVIDALYKEAVDTGIEAKRTKENFENGVEGYTEEMVKESETAHDEAMNAWVDAYEEANGIGSDVGKGLATGLEDETSFVVDTANGVGSDMSKGIEDGLESNRFNLIKKAKSLINNIWTAMRAEADSHSPSRKTMALGSDMGEGLKIGLDDTEKMIESSGENLVRRAIIPIEASISGISWNNLDTTFGTTLSAASNVSVQNRTMMELLPGIEDTADSNTTPLVLQVDGKTFAETTIETLNGHIRQTGSLGLIMV